MAPQKLESSNLSAMNESKTTAIPTFSPRAALPPRVLPLYATTIRCRLRQPLGIHRTLVSKPYYKPSPATKPKGIDLTSCFSNSSSDTPPSPLTPLGHDFGSDSPEVHVNLIPRPDPELTVPETWNSQVATSYRVGSSIRFASSSLTVYSENSPESGRC